MKYIFVLFATLLLAFTSCERAKKTINKTGETVGEGTSEFVNGISSGIDKTFQCELDLNPALKAKGLSTGKFKIGDSEGSKNNVVTVYLLFDKDFSDSLSLKVVDVKGLEYGRLRTPVAGKKGEGKYIDFTFDKRTEIESRSKLVID